MTLKPSPVISRALLAPSLSLSEISSPEKIKHITECIKFRFHENLRDISVTPDNFTGDNNPYNVFSRALGEASEKSVLVTLPSMVHYDSEVREASSNAKDELKSMFDRALADQSLYEKLEAFNQQPAHDVSEERFRSMLLSSFKRNGCSLSSSVDRQTVMEKRGTIEELCSAFTLAINENNDILLFTENELNGVDNLDQFPLIEENHQEKISMREVSLKSPFTMPVLQFAKNPSTRRKVSVAMAKKCQELNTERFLSTIKLRHDCALLMGYESHAHFMLEPKMATNPQQAENFLLELLDTAKIKCRNDLALLKELKQKEEGTNEPIQPWDIQYYTRIYKKSIGVDAAELQKYFPLDHVKREILKIYEELLKLTFEIVEDADVWHIDVECYVVRSKISASTSDSSDILGYFYLDLFPRPGKYSHQCVYPLRPSYNCGDSRVRPACANIGNLTPNKEGKPSMLPFSQVVTFFHEFGHVMHCVLTKSKHSIQAWAWSAVPWPGGVEQDFLEVPSMMLENFVWQPEILRRLSKSKEGLPLPEATIDALCHSRFVMNSYSTTKYLSMSLYDITVHSGSGPFLYKGNEYDAVSLYEAMVTNNTGVASIPGAFPVASWFHLMMGYDAGYYSYIWSEAFAADLFSEFEKMETGIVDNELGERYRDAILSPCAMYDGETMLRSFLGRQPSKDAFVNRMRNG